MPLFPEVGEVETAGSSAEHGYAHNLPP